MGSFKIVEVFVNLDAYPSNAFHKRIDDLQPALVPCISSSTRGISAKKTLIKKPFVCPCEGEALFSLPLMILRGLLSHNLCRRVSVNEISIVGCICEVSFLVALRINRAKCGINTSRCHNRLVVCPDEFRYNHNLTSSIVGS